MRATILFNQELSPSYRRIGLLAPEFGGGFRAGQFVMVRPPQVQDPLLPRAFSIYRVSSPAGGPAVEMLYKIVGKGTQCLARMEPGQPLEILGPLGNGFTLPGDGEQGILVAGGIGVPPIAALACELSRQPSAIGHQQVFLGGRTAEDILCLEDFETAGAEVHVTTEDGSQGHRGLITDLLEPFLRAASGGPVTIYTCGPAGMLAAVARLAERHDARCQTSVEANMACGFGACMGCAVEARSATGAPAYRLVCKEGPVFDSRELVWP
jgi:dihydroorotate dehydrogenase electron transfer subunit